MSNQPKYGDPDLFTELAYEEAWLAGLIWADGCLVELDGGRRQRISVSSNDRELADFAGLIMGCPVNVNHRSRGDKAHFSVGCTLDAPINRLRALGMTPRKSLTTTYPDIPAAADRHFIRGYFDGDGSVMGKQNAADRARGNHPPCLNTVIAGSESFLEGLQDRLCPATGIKRKRLVFSKIYRLTLGHADSMAFADYIYAEPGPCLSRKHARYAAGRRPIAHWWAKGV